MSKPRKMILPDHFQAAHDLCCRNLNVLSRLWEGGEKEGSFIHEFYFRDESDRKAFAEADDVFQWLKRTRPLADQAALLRRLIFPALLVDFLHFVDEALETSRNGKLGVSYALIRKPIQDTLYVFEALIDDLEGFAGRLATDPTLLDSKGLGGLAPHTERITRVVRCLHEERRFDPDYLARLRYDKSTDDGFDGTANKALHLFTRHGAIRTEPLNINFVFSGWEQQLTQWHYLYSRLPYVLFYARRVIEHLFATFEPRTNPDYLDDIERRVEAATLLWARDIDAHYQSSQILNFVERTRERLEAQLAGMGCSNPTARDLARIRDTGVVRSRLNWLLRWRH